MEIWLVRHGESTWNSARRFQGAHDAPLSARGRAQAEALAAWLAGTRFDALYTSPLSRARDTALACARILGVEPRAEPDLREIGLGAWEGETVEAVLTRDADAYQRWLDTPVDHPPPGGEALPELAGRVGRALDALAARHRDERVLVVSHGGAIGAVLCGWLGRPLNTIWQLRLANASITRVTLPGGQVLGVNETAHLDAVPAADGAAP